MQQIEFIEQIQEMLKANEKPFLNFEEARAFLGVSKSTLYKLTHQRKIKHLKPNKGKLWFRKSDLIAWMNSNPVKSVEEIEEIAVNHIMYK